MSKVLTLNEFKKLKIYRNPNGRNNLRYFDDEHLLKLTRCDERYWERLMSKKIRGFNIPNACFRVTPEIEEYVNASFSESFNSAVTSTYLEEYQSLNNFSFFENQLDFLKLMKEVFLNNANAVNSGFIHTDYTPYNIMINHNYESMIIDLESSIVDGYSSFEPRRAQNLEYLYGKKEYDSELELINCGKLTLLNIFLLVLADGKLVDNRVASISQYTIGRKISSIGLPFEFEEKYKRLLLKQALPKNNDFFTDDLDELINSDWSFKKSC